MLFGEKCFPWEKKSWERVWIKEPKFSEYGIEPHKQRVDNLIKNGLVVIDKPSGPTSHQVVDYVKKILKIDKAGHSGTLDPQVTGVLPVALGNATKVIQALLLSGKEYVCLFKLHKIIEEERLFGAISKMVGEINQLPPRRSAVKRVIRKRKVYYVELLDKEPPYYLIRIGVEAGTYIRKWVHDLGIRLGVGAHMVDLRRTRVGCIDEKKCISLQDLSDNLFFYEKFNDETLIRRSIFPIEEGLKHLPKIFVSDGSVNSLCNGASLKIPGVVGFEGEFKQGELIALMTLKGELIALAKAEIDKESLLNLNRGVVARLVRVIMESGRYPKITP